MRKKMINVGWGLALAAGAAGAQVVGTLTAPLQLQIPVGSRGMTLGVPLPAPRAPASAASGAADVVKAAVQPSAQAPQFFAAPPEQAEQPKLPALKRSEVPGWPQLADH